MPSQLVTFEVTHKPGYRLKMRMGIHSGSAVAGVVGTKIPHYSVFGDTVEMAGIMEATGEPMKVQVLKSINSQLRSVTLQYFTQVSGETRNMLKKAGGYNMIKREPPCPKLPEGMVTYWLVGLTGGAEYTAVANTNIEDNKSNSLAPTK